MLQRPSERAVGMMDVKEEVGVGTTEYEYAGAEISISAESDVALYGKGLWIITVKEGCTSEDVEKMSKNMPKGSKANYSGHPEEGGMCVFMMEGTEADVKQELDTHTWPSKPSVTADGPIRAVPEIGAHEDDDSESLLESGAPASWGLDRIDDPVGLDNSYSARETYPNQGRGTHVYVLDTGILTSHSDFGGRAYSAWTAYPSIETCKPRDTRCGADGNGHGTHCAGTIGGSTYGVAKQAKLYGVKVLGDVGGGAYSYIVRGIDFVMRNGHKPAIISMSLGGKGNVPAVTSAVDSAVNRGIPVVVAAGNDGRSSVPDACKYTPAHIPSAITVGATDRPTGSTDRRAGYSNYGRCLDIYAPGSNIKSASHRSSRGSATLSGTSMACPHVSGVAALLMGENPRLTPASITAQLLAQATRGSIRDAKSGSPNLMLQIGGGGGGGGGGRPQEPTYKMLGRPLYVAVNEGRHLRAAPWKTLAQCKALCDGTRGCNSLAWCPNWGNYCLLKDKKLTGNEPTKYKYYCSTYYAVK